MSTEQLVLPEAPDIRLQMLLDYGPCPLSPDSDHTWSLCVHADGTEHAACVYCHIDY